VLYVIQPQMLIVVNFVVDPDAISVCASLSHDAPMAGQDGTIVKKTLVFFCLICVKFY